MRLIAAPITGPKIIPIATPTPTLPGGTYSSTSGLLVINPSTGVIDLDASTAGTYDVQYLTNGACPDSSTQSITITPLDDATFAYLATIYCVIATDPTPTPTPTGDDLVCTQDVRECPDGEFVSRNEKNDCKFPVCGWDAEKHKNMYTSWVYDQPVHYSYDFKYFIKSTVLFEFIIFSKHLTLMNLFFLHLTEEPLSKLQGVWIVEFHFAIMDAQLITSYLNGII